MYYKNTETIKVVIVSRYGSKREKSTEFMDSGVGYGTPQLGNSKNIIQIKNLLLIKVQLKLL